MKYDLAVIGGGIIGAGVARDAALRGLKVALLEQDDFGSGTTSRSTRLIHGGLRYLAQYDFALVGEALKERRILLEIAPHLVRPLPFLLPIYKQRGHALPLVWTGLMFYDFLRFQRGVPHHRLLPSNACLRLEPTLRRQGLRGGFLFYDCQCAFPERLCLENVLDAAEHDARVENHARVVALERSGSVVHGLRVHHEIPDDEVTVNARLTLNCAGPWLDEVEQLRDPRAPRHLRRTKGIHLVVPRFTQHALILEAEEMDRVVFAIPWGDYTLVGTTDTDYQGPNENVRATREDIEYLIGEIERQLDHKIGPKDVLFTTAGLRPLPNQEGRTPAEITRRHLIIDHEMENQLKGYATVVGGKITTYRNIAEEITNFALRKLGYAPTECLTAAQPLPGGRFEGGWNHFLADILNEAKRVNVSADIARHLADQYGAEAMGLLETIHQRPELGARIHPKGPWTWVQVDHAIVHEDAQTLTDVMLRRLTIGLSQGQGKTVADSVAQAMTHYMPWDENRLLREVQEYRATLDRNWASGITEPAPAFAPIP